MFSRQRFTIWSCYLHLIRVSTSKTNQRPTSSQTLRSLTRSFRQKLLNYSETGEAYSRKSSSYCWNNSRSYKFQMRVARCIHDSRLPFRGKPSTVCRRKKETEAAARLLSAFAKTTETRILAKTEELSWRLCWRGCEFWKIGRLRRIS